MITGLPVRSIENLVERLSHWTSIELCFGCSRQIAGMNELGDVVAGRKANMDGVFSAGGRIIVLKLFSQSMSSNSNDGIHLGVKRFRASERMHCDAVLFDFVDCAFKVFVANKREESNWVVGPPEHSR